MATVTLPYAYTDGDVTSEEHNDNIFGTADNDGVLRGINGGLDDTNLDPGFELSVDLIQPAGAIYMDHTSMQTAQVDYVSEFMGSDTDDLNYVVIAGAGVRFYLPYPVSFLKLEINAQIGPWICASISASASILAPATPTDTQGILRVYVDGSAETQHDTLLHNWATSQNPSDAAPEVSRGYSGRCVRHLSFQHMAADMDAGWHEVMLRVAIDAATLSSPTISGGFNGTSAGGVDFGANTTYAIFGRVTAYNRGATAMGFK